MPSDEVELVSTKWGGSDHWHVPGRRLGVDTHGTWLGCPAGTRIWRPGLEVVLTDASVVCVPEARWWVATMYDVSTPGAVEVYVDITTVATWSPGVVTVVDLDLDVVLPHAGEAYVDDEDEFAVHRLSYGYPTDVVAAAETACATVLDAVSTRRPPFDPATARRWLARLAP